MLAAYPLRLMTAALQDDDEVRWSLDDKIDCLNSAQFALVSVRPDAKNITKAVQLAPGTKQSLPTGGIRVLNVIRNMGSDGSTPGKVITLASRPSFDNTRPGWHGDAAKKEPRHWFYDSRTPGEFYVWPPVHATAAVYAELSYSIEPALIPRTTDRPAYNANTTEISVSGAYVNPLVEFALYRAFDRDSETADMQLAVHHLQLFYNMLGIDSSKAAIHSQPNRERPYSRVETNVVEV